MALTNLFKIGATDLTKFEDTEKHVVNREDIFEEWVDGNYIQHRILSRTQITGTVFLEFTKPNDYSSFLTLLSAARDAEGFYNVTVWCSNTGTAETIDAYLDITGETKWDVTTPMKYHGVTIQIVER